MELVMDTDLKTIAYLIMNCAGLISLSIMCGILFCKWTVETKCFNNQALPLFMKFKLPTLLSIIEAPILIVCIVWLLVKLIPTLFAPWSFLGFGGQAAFLLLYIASLTAAIAGYKIKKDILIKQHITTKAKYILILVIILMTINLIFYNWWVAAQ
ncbi:MAG: hypothetical protein PHR00_00070 [Patescibacteria group bacterium]|nr:hypothetical protein [Patescibacteria group bacterium]